jgi:hypothetical protein
MSGGVVCQHRSAICGHVLGFLSHGLGQGSHFLDIIRSLEVLPISGRLLTHQNGLFVCVCLSSSWVVVDGEVSRRASTGAITVNYATRKARRTDLQIL